MKCRICKQSIVKRQERCYVPYQASTGRFMRAHFHCECCNQRPADYARIYDRLEQGERIAKGGGV